MSGHSKWSKVKHIKAVEDVRKGKAFSKAVREIMVAARSGGDPTTNPALREAIERAKAVNLPKDRIKSAIEKGTGGGGQGMGLEELIFEGYGPAGVAFLVKAATDNRNRTTAEVRRLFSQYGGSLGGAGSTTYIFKDPEKPLFEVEVGEKREKVAGLVSTLESLEDVSEVRTNLKR